MVSFEGVSRPMLFQNSGEFPNWRATAILRQPNTLMLDWISEEDDVARGDALVLLSTRWKPYADINSTIDWSDMYEHSQQKLRGWWHAVATDRGWRVFADDLNGLFFLKLAC